MISETFKQVLADECIVAIVTRSESGPHVVNTWNSYVTITSDGSLLIPVSRMHKTEKNLDNDNRVLLTIGSRNVPGLRYVGTGFLVEGTAALETQDEHFERMKARFDWMRAVMVVKPETITQTL